MKSFEKTKGDYSLVHLHHKLNVLLNLSEVQKNMGRYVVIEGRSMKTNVSIVKHLNLTDLEHVIPVEDMHKYPPNKIMILATGAQGEQYALLDRIADGTHKNILNLLNTTLLFFHHQLFQETNVR
jgi:ribonuclease J